ncbi:helix-turn-helix domain-containing protein [Flavobacterium pectinovorum]|uniref:AraC family transcriptional regulator n=1 Tax=Flavobacterium pectinovorum TaxID=29533 RepID=A0AB36P0X1_9FLAO|nr:helix-turn-helix domain-containing protein [Flavobacterium pectinovorum]OXB04491.1 AraC family transcriptional regulator [Flavobacterium pectinovorum]SHL60390.1 transcriptional regulator, AraC family [Flavobacterium pectinovorum]
MEFEAKYITPDIKLSSYEDKFFKSDIIFDQHMLVWFISGETKIVQADTIHIFKKGDIFLIPRNQLATIINYPKDGEPHKTVVMHLTTARLKDFYANLDIKPKTSISPKINHYNNHPLLESCLTSLIPYFDMTALPEDIASLKITEAITILRTIDKEIDNILANFEEPGKIDLVHFMERNFMFNMPLDRLGYLTGRSLSTFNRDFRKYFGTTPQKWLTAKRLELAHYELTKNKKKAIDVCYEVGFENLSHFSFAFKKQFGYTASELVTANLNVLTKNGDLIV